MICAFFGKHNRNTTRNLIIYRLVDPKLQSTLCAVKKRNTQINPII